MDELYTVGRDLEEQRLDNAMQRLLGLPRSLTFKLIRKGRIRVNGRKVKISYRLVPGDEIEVRFAGQVRRPKEADHREIPQGALDEVARRIVHREEELLLVDKPAGWVVHAGSGHSWGLIEALRELIGDEVPARPVLLNRLDRDVSGLVLVTTSSAATRRLGRAQVRGELDKQYLALVEGELEEERGVLHDELQWVEAPGRDRMEVVADGDQEALTEYRLLGRREGMSLVRLTLGTGRKHQLRVQLQHAGHPIVGDRKYGHMETADRFQRRFGLERLFLQAHRLGFTHPRSGERFEHELPLAPALRRVWEGLVSD